MALNKSRLGEVTAFSGRALHWTIARGKNECIFIEILASVNLTECHRMAISGYSLCRLNIFG